MRFQVILSGLGGQGVLFATRILARAAEKLDHGVFVSETHGMAQRGGNVISHLKVYSRDEPFFSPLIKSGTADVLLAFHYEALAVHGYFLKNSGLAVCNLPAGSMPKDEPGAESGGMTIKSIDATSIAMRLGNPGLANVVLLGFASAGGWLFAPADHVREAVREVSGARAPENLRAFDAGVENLSGEKPC